ncbi:EF-hand domain-containing protein [Polynucleobacter paneuropaeus]|nr:EF-hand domain-containing protein [Polynucleobacter paneuropaeus]QWD35390.1 EF-hand domain-containing protein [Polynucleobacter paneuropaeus]
MSAEDKEIVAKFKAADKNHDGKLTLAEAQAGMPRVAAHFSYIDSQGRGYVTLDQILALANN